MKAKSLTFLLFLVTIYIHAQDVKFGLQTGLVVANSCMTDYPAVQGNEAPRVYYPLISGNLNAYFGYKTKGIFGFSVEPGFIQKGEILEGNKDHNDDDIKMKYNYLQMPILADFFITKDLFVSIGPELAYMVSAKAKSKDHANNIYDWIDNKFEFSGILGVSYTFFKKLDVGLRYNHGITLINEITLTDEEGMITGTIKEYNQYFQLLIRFKV